LQYVGVIKGKKRRVAVVANMEEVPVAILKSMIKQSCFFEDE
jgi:hypothetical protein